MKAKRKYLIEQYVKYIQGYETKKFGRSSIDFNLAKFALKDFTDTELEADLINVKKDADEA